MFIMHSYFLNITVLSVLKGYSEFNNNIFYNRRLSSKKVVAPFQVWKITIDTEKYGN